MPEYINPNSFVVQLVGPNGESLSVRSHQRLVLDEYFDRYVTRGYLKRSTTGETIKARRPITRHSKQLKPKLRKTEVKVKPQQNTPKHKKQVIRRAQQVSLRKKQEKEKRPSRTKIVGKRINIDGKELLKHNLATKAYPISNGIGVGILSYNRVNSLRRLVDSIVQYTDLLRTTVFISDDCSTDQATKDYLDTLAAENKNIIIIRNSENIGIAGNTNRLIRCLSRFKHCLLLNDDVEVLKQGWDSFYAEACKASGMHHFQYRQTGVYGAQLGSPINHNGVDLLVVNDKPQGAVLACTHQMLVLCGYLDESYGQYGMEHVDWSSKAYELQLQPSGYYDVVGSDEYFRLHPEGSAVEDRVAKLRAARELYANRKVERIGPTPRSRVPEITYIIPFRNLGRQDCIATVINNVRAQRFPVIHTIIVEQDQKQSTNISPLEPVHYYLAQETERLLFNKSKAFNLGVSQAKTEKVILHDADMIITGDYTAAVWSVLRNYEACHLGGTVIYATQAATGGINANQLVTADTDLERAVGYFEGGSLACSTKAYWRVGAFNEDFFGYGCEDCEFYARLSQNSAWREDRRFDFLHLWHGRAENWHAHHEANCVLEYSLSKLSMPTRIEKQYQQLRKLGYEAQVEESLR